MNQTSRILAILIGLVLLGGAFLFSITGNANRHAGDTVHQHAGFLVVIDGVTQDYSGREFMNVQPCMEKSQEHKLTTAEEQLEKAHLHDGVGNVVHVHRAGATWGDLFQNLNVNLPDPLVGYFENEIFQDQVLQSEILPYERVLFVSGEPHDDPDVLRDQIPGVERITEVEQMSESCGST